jgi:hypothetical protein
MNPNREAATESQAGDSTPAVHASIVTSPIRFSRTTTQSSGGNNHTEVFKMTLGEESILLVPLKNWGQLDNHKWVARGRLPATPPGFEVKPDHVMIAGEEVSIQDPEGCAKLEKVFAEWLALETQTLELARKKPATRPVPAAAETPDPAQPPHFKVEVDKSGHIHLRCLKGKETLALVGLNPAGFKSLFNQGLMRKPHSLQTGALHDWVELDGVIFSFEKGRNDAPKLEEALNSRYLPAPTLGQGMDVVIYANAASSTGFDVQFPAMVGGTLDKHRRPLNEDSLELLQDQAHCGLLVEGIVIRLTRPTLVFKQKTDGGGERNLESCPENLVHSTNEDGMESIIDLSHPVHYTRLSTVEMTAVFNHPAIHKHGKAAVRNGGVTSGPPAFSPPTPTNVPASPPPLPPMLPVVRAETPSIPAVAPMPAPVPSLPARLREPEPKPLVKLEPVTNIAPQPPVEPSKPRPNAWLKEALAKPVARHDWFASLAYRQMARTIGNSSQGHLGLSNCWAIALDEAEDISDPGFRGFFLTEKSGFGFLNQGHLVRFNKGVAFAGMQETAIEGIGVDLIAVALDQDWHAYFIVSEDYRSKFSLPETTVAQELKRLEEFGATVLSVSEALSCPEALWVVWTVPAQPGESGEIEAVELNRPRTEEANQHLSPAGPAI